MNRDWRPDFCAVIVAKFEAEGGKRAQPEIVRRAAADAEKNGSAAQFCGRANELTCSIGRGLPGIALRWRQQAESAGGRHLDDCDRPAGTAALPWQTQPRPDRSRDLRRCGQTDAGGDEATPRTADVNHHAAAPHGSRKDLDEPFAAVSQRAGIQLPAGLAPAQRADTEIASLWSAQRPLEFVKSNKNAHLQRLGASGETEKTY